MPANWCNSPCLLVLDLKYSLYIAAMSSHNVYIYAKQKHLGCKKGEANQKQQLSDYKSIHSYTCD